MTQKGRPKLVLIGGGTGSFALLKALKEYPLDITALVNMTDDGGSTGVLRDELGVLPPGDVRQCLVALSQASEELRNLFTFRFPAGGSLAGHSFGNIFLSAVESMTTNFTSAIKVAGDVLQIQGKVLPTTIDNCRLMLKQGNQIISGQHAIETTTLISRQPALYLEPAAKLLPEAAQAIKTADVVVIAPGLLYGSLAPALLVNGMAKALAKTKAPLIYVANLVNKPGQTDGYAVHDYASEIERFISPAKLHTVIYNSDTPTASQLKEYAAEGELPVKVEAATLAKAHYAAVPLDCLSHEPVKRDPNDTLLIRSLIRHDGEAVAKWLTDFLQNRPL